MIEHIAQFLTEYTGTPVSNGEVTVMLAIVAGCVLALLFAKAWVNSGQVDWDAVEAERERLEAEERDNGTD